MADHSSDNISVADLQRLETRIGGMERQMADVAASIRSISEIVPGIREALLWIEREKALSEPREDRWAKTEHRLQKLEDSIQALREENTRMRERDRISSWAFGLVIAIGTSVITSWIAKGLK